MRRELQVDRPMHKIHACSSEVVIVAKRSVAKSALVVVGYFLS